MDIKNDIKLCNKYVIINNKQKICINIMKKNDDNEINEILLYYMLFWIYTLNNTGYNTAYNTGYNTIKVFLYLLDENKLVNENNIYNNNLDTYSGFTGEKEIVIFRKEEIIKVFIHETIHLFGIDLSRINNKKCITELFPSIKNFKFYEMYTEVWCKLLNCMICSYFTIGKLKTFESYFKCYKRYLSYEILHGFYQAQKILNIYNLTYEDLTKYKKIPNKLQELLPCYVFPTILIEESNSFIKIFTEHNKNDIELDINLCMLIKKVHNKKNMIKKFSLPIKCKDYLLKNTLRKSIIELLAWR